MNDARIADLEFHDLSSGVSVGLTLEAPRTREEIQRVIARFNAENNLDENTRVSFSLRNLLLVSDLKVPRRIVAMLDELGR